MLFGNTAAIFTDEAHRVRFINQDHRARFFRNADHFLQGGHIAKHRIDALKHHQLACIGGQTLKTLLKRFHIIMAEGNDFGIAHFATIIDRRMAVDVEDDVITLARDRTDNAQIGLIARGKDHRMVHPVKFLQRVFAFLVALKRAI